jgi:hypothetical protein
MPSTFSSPPASTPVNEAAQVAATIGVFAALVVIAVAAYRLGRRWSSWAPALVVLSTLWAGFYEPIFNVTSHLWYYRPGQVTFFDSFGGSLPVWVFFSYGAFYGGLGLLAWWLTEKGAPRGQLVRFVVGLWAASIVLEVDLYEYYGRAPFRVAGFPAWISLANAAICTTIGIAAARLRRLVTGRRQLALLFLGPAVITTGLAGTAFPALVAVNTVDPSNWLLYGAAVVSMAMAAVMAWSATQLVPVQGLQPVTAAEPADRRVPATLRTPVRAGA